MNKFFIIFLLFANIFTIQANAQNGQNTEQEKNREQKIAEYNRKIDSIGNPMLPSLDANAKTVAFIQLADLYALTSCVDRKIDSLNNLLSSFYGIDKLYIYHWLCYLYEYSLRSEEQLGCMQEAIKYARKQKHKKYESSFRRQVMIIYYNHGDKIWKQYLERISDDMDFWRNNEYWENYYYAFYLETMSYIRNNKIQTALAKAREECDKSKKRGFLYGEGIALGVMGQAYMSLENYIEASKCFNESIEFLKRDLVENGIVKGGGQCSILFFDFYNQLAHCLNAIGDRDGTIRALSNCGQYLKTNVGVSPVLLFEWYATSAMLYSELGRIFEAEKSLKGADSIFNLIEHPFIIVLIHKDAHMRLCFVQKKYSEALKPIDFLLQNKELLDIDGHMILLQYKARIADSLENTAMAAETYRTLYRLTDSIKKEKMAIQLDEMRTLYELDRHVMEKNRIRNYSILAVSVCVLILLGLIFHIWKIRKKNRGLVRQIKEQDRLAAKLENLTARYEALILAKIQNDKHDNRQKNKQNDKYQLEIINVEFAAEHELYYKLFVRLREYMLTDRNFAKSVDQNELSMKLSTNRSYLFKAVKIVTGKTLQEYVNILRLDEAKRLLDTSNYTVETIVELCGFSNIRTFYRLFRSRYDITTSEYKRHYEGNP